MAGRRFGSWSYGPGKGLSGEEGPFCRVPAWSLTGGGATPMRAGVSRAQADGWRGRRTGSRRHRSAAWRTLASFMASVVMSSMRSREETREHKGALGHRPHQQQRFRRRVVGLRVPERRYRRVNMIGSLPLVLARTHFGTMAPAESVAYQPVVGGRTTPAAQRKAPAQRRRSPGRFARVACIASRRRPTSDRMDASRLRRNAR